MVKMEPGLDIVRHWVYKSAKMFGVRLRDRFCLFTVILCFAVAFCAVDHMGPNIDPMSGSSGHPHAGFSACIPDLCVTLTTKEIAGLGEISGLLFLLSLVLVLKSNGQLYPQELSFQYPSTGNIYPFKTSNKLYQLHSAYLL